jgi:hypothetical protein
MGNSAKSTAMGNRRINVSLSPDTHRLLRRISVEQDLPLADIVMLAVERLRGSELDPGAKR